MFKQFVRVFAAALATLGLALGTAFVAPTGALAASGSVTIGSPKGANPIDKWTKGSITTPVIGTKGQAKITSRSYVFITSGRVVARTSTAAKKVALSIGSYQVKVSVAYKVGTARKSASKTFTVKIVNSGRMSYAEYKLIKPGQTLSEVAGIVGSRGTDTYNSYDDDCDSDYETGEETCVSTHHQGREWKVASEYGYASVYFTNGRVDSGYFKHYFSI